ncbi:MAG TPA: energy-coupling factor transporter transmembrane component T [Anaerolineales bacterium]|nr:energy-coupling factor transporter transmembrane component T [Anaerolineales bacterium]
MAAPEHSLRYIPGSSALHRTYPLTKVGWLLVVATGLFIYRSPLSGAVVLGSVLILTLLVARVPFKAIISSSSVIFGVGIILTIFHLFADPGRPVLHIGPLAVTEGGLAEGPIYFFRLSTVVLASFLLIWTTDIRDLMVSIARAGVPYRYAYAVFLSLRFLPMIQREVDAVRDAHSIRGMAAKTSLAHRFQLWRRYVFTVLINGLRKAEATATALDSRAFGAYPTRTYIKAVEFHPGGLILPAGFLVLTGVLIYLERSALG